MSGRDDQFEQFVRARYPALVRTARGLVGPAAAEDLVQSCLVKTGARWGRLRDPQAAEAYVRTTMYRLAGRWSARRWTGEIATGDVPEQSGPDATTSVDLADALRRALARLPFDQRAVVLLRFYDDLSEQQTAAVLDCSVGTVKSRTSRALEALRAAGSVPFLREDIR